MEHSELSPFSRLLGPITVRWEPVPLFEVVVRKDCANSMGRAHGGFLSALVDITTGQGVKRILGDGRSLVTVATNTEYLGPARVSELLMLEVGLEHSTNALVFASCRVSVATRPVARSSVVFSAGGDGEAATPSRN